METRNCQNCKKDFTITPDDFSFYKKIKVPMPTFCHECKLIRKMVWRNLRSLYKRECGLCHKSVISMYPDTDPAPVYCYECWNSDKWDAKSYGQEIDWSRPFLLQWFELFQRVPRLLNYMGGLIINSDYTNYSVGNKDCYMSFSIIECENVYHSESIDKSRDCVDCSAAQNLNQCTYNIDSEGNYNSHYLIRSQNCIDSYFLFDCSNCQNCCLSSNLRNQQYVFKNKKLSKEEYRKAVSELHLETYSGLESTKVIFKNTLATAITKYATIYNAQSCTGDFISDAKNIIYTFDAHDAEDIFNSIRVIHSKDCRDCVGILSGEFEYETLACSINSSNIVFSHICLSSSAVEYSALSRSISDCFGCAGLTSSSYCILNKQYTKEEYEMLVEKIKIHMNEMPYKNPQGIIYRYGEFFPFEFCPFGYNESISGDFFPISKEQALEKGYKWNDREKRQYQSTISANDLPDSILNSTDAIKSETITCIHEGECEHSCTGAFRITDMEFNFLKQKNLPLPRLCPNCRHHERLQFRNPYKLWGRQCMCDKTTHFHSEVPCPNEFETSYAPDRPEKVYCEECYQVEVL
jgi:hypothetical protein